MNAVIYARQSSGSDDHSESVEVQIKNCLQLAQKEHLNVIGIFQDLNISGKTYPENFENIAENDRAFQNWYAGQSGNKKYRSGLGNLFKILPKIDYIIVDDATRLYRPVNRSFLEAFVNQKLTENQVRLLQVKGGLLDLASFDQNLINMLKNQINDEQIAKQRLKSLEVMQKLKNQGILPTGAKAWGLIYDIKSKKISADPQKAEVIKYIFNRIGAYAPYAEIVRQINRNHADLFKKCFWSKSLYSIAGNPIYCGCQYNSSGEIIKNQQWDGIIDFELFERVQKIIQYRKNHCSCAKCANHAGEQRHFLPLSGYLYCGNCGSKLVVAIDRGKIFYYCKTGYLTGDLLCRRSRIIADLAIPQLIGVMQGAKKFFPAALKIRLKNLEQQRQLTARQNEIESKIRHYTEKLTAINEAFVADKMPIEFFRHTTGKISRTIKQLKIEEHLCRLSRPDNYESEVKKIEELKRRIKRSNLADADYESLLHESIKKIIVHPDFVIFSTSDGDFSIRRKIIKKRKGLSTQTPQNIPAVVKRVED